MRSLDGGMCRRMKYKITGVLRERYLIACLATGKGKGDIFDTGRCTGRSDAHYHRKRGRDYVARAIHAIEIFRGS